MTTEKPKRRRKNLSPEDKRIGKIEKSVGDIASAVAGLTDIVSSMQEKQLAPAVLPRTQSDESLIERVSTEVSAQSIAKEAASNPDNVVSRRRSVDLLNPRAGIEGFREGDVVRLREDSPKLLLIRENQAGLDPEEDILGVVHSFMRVDRDGSKKYKVRFPKIGQDGVREEELELAKSSV